MYKRQLLDALTALENQPGIHNAALAGDRLRVLARPGWAPAQIATLLGSQGVIVTQIAPGQPTIEDVFMALANG